MEHPKNAPKDARVKWHQRKVLINSKVQLVFIGYAISMGFLFLSFGLVLASSFERILMLKMNSMNDFSTFDLVVFGTFLILAAIAIYLGMIVSNRVVGPIFRLVKHMEEFGTTGKLEELHFRKNDYFKDVAISYNKIVARLSSLESAKNPEPVVLKK